MRTILKSFLVLYFFTFSSASLADTAFSGFLDNYEQLTPSDDPWLDYQYVVPNYVERAANIDSIIIDDPEFFLANDSKYKGLKAKNMNYLADVFKGAMVDAFEDKYKFSESPGPGTVLLRMAFTNLYIQKKGRKIRQYVPVAYVATSAKRKLLDDFTKRVDLVGAYVEMELVESETGERLGAMVTKLGNNNNKENFTSWDELLDTLVVSASRLRCRFDNAELPEQDRQDCMARTSF